MTESQPPPIPHEHAVPPPVPLFGEAVSEAEDVDELDQERGRQFPCEKCGADLEFHIGQQSLKCSFCGYVKDLTMGPQLTVEEQDFHGMLEHLAELRSQGAQEELEDVEVDCEKCGATIRFSGELTSSECVYCGAPLQRDEIHQAEHRVPADGVLPFQVDRKAARKELSEWVTSRWFAPGEFKKRGVDGKFSGIYMPYWTYDTLTANSYRGERGEHYWVTRGTGKNRRRERRTRWYSASGAFKRFFDDVLVFGARGVSRKHAESLDPWPLHRCLPFTQEVMAGFLSETYQVPLDEGFALAKQKIDSALRADVRRRIGGDEQRIHAINSRYDAITYKLLFLPIWVLAYRYKEKPYQVVINAATGKLVGTRPYSIWKIMFTVLLVVAIAGTIAAIAGR